MHAIVQIKSAAKVRKIFGLCKRARIFFVFSAFSVWLGHRQISPSLSSLCVRTVILISLCSNDSFATFRPLSLCHVSRGHKRQEPARNVLKAGVTHAECDACCLRGILSRMFRSLKSDFIRYFSQKNPPFTIFA